MISTAHATPAPASLRRPASTPCANDPPPCVSTVDSTATSSPSSTPLRRRDASSTTGSGKCSSCVHNAGIAWSSNSSTSGFSPACSHIPAKSSDRSRQVPSRSRSTRSASRTRCPSRSKLAGGLMYPISRDATAAKHASASIAARVRLPDWYPSIASRSPRPRSTSRAPASSPATAGWFGVTNAASSSGAGVSPPQWSNGNRSMSSRRSATRPPRSAVTTRLVRSRSVLPASLPASSRGPLGSRL